MVASYLILGMLACGELSYIHQHSTTLIFSGGEHNTEMLVLFNDPENEPLEIGKLSIILCHSYQETNINLDTLPFLYPTDH